MYLIMFLVEKKTMVIAITIHLLPDGRISTGTIEPGESVTITFDDAGFYRLYDPDYPWMKIVAYVFPNTDKLDL